MNNNSIALGKIISNARVNKGLSQRELAKQINIDNSGLAKIENGSRKKPNILTLKKLSKILNVDYKELLSLAGYNDTELSLYLHEDEEIYNYVIGNIVKNHNVKEEKWYKDLNTSDKKAVKKILTNCEDSMNSKNNNTYECKYSNINDLKEKELFEFYDKLNNDTEHMVSSDDICTPMECVKRMIDYIPENFWENSKIKILDPCSGNGNFGAYIRFKTNEKNIWYNELNPIRYINCKALLNPTHLNNGDFFDINDKKWDLIVANPPYSGGGNKNRSLSNLFIEHSIDLLNDNGYLCFITPNNWMTYNNNNNTLKRLLNEGSFLVIDNDCKKYFKGVGSSFTIILWQKNVLDNKTFVVNNFLLKDNQKDVVLYKDLKCIPLYISQDTIDIFRKAIGNEENNRFFYRCDLHNFTQKKYLSDEQDDVFKYRTIHTARKTRYSSKMQDIYKKWNIIVPLSTYYEPFIDHNTNVTQSVGYISFENKENAIQYLRKITQECFKVIIHLTRYGNFNNIMTLKHIKYDEPINFTNSELATIHKLDSKLPY